MQGFFHPRSVVVIGVSPRHGNLGRNIVDNLEAYGFPGPVYLVSPRGGEYHGRTIHTSLEQLPETPELAVILTPAATVPRLMEDCGRKGIKRVIIESGGFSELADERARLEGELVEIAGRHGMRFIGPNCIGTICTHSGLAVPFPRLGAPLPKGGLSMIMQSGGIGLTYLYALGQAGVGISKFASVGNKLNVNERDLLAYLVEDPQTEAILLYLESIVAGREIFEILRGCPKPVVLHKSNIAPLSNAIAHSHTAALANDDAVVDAALEQAGVLRAHTVSETINLCKAVVLPPPRGRRLAVISRSGGHAVVAADAAFREGMELPRFPASYLESIQSHARAAVIRLQNPLDLGDLFHFELYVDILRGALAMEQVDAAVVVHGYRGPETEPSRRFVARAGELSREYGKPVALVLLTEFEELVQARRLTTLPFFPAPDEAIQALSAARWVVERREAGAKKDPLPQVDLAAAREILSQAAPDGSLSLPQSLALAAAAGLPVAEHRTVQTPEQAAAAARELGGRLVLKAVGLEHKTDQGGVALDLEGAEAVAKAAAEMQERLGVASLVVMRQVQAPHEVIVGAKQDPSFGALVLAGLGGIAAEVFKDFSLRLAPVGPGEAKEMLSRLKSAPLLQGFRGAPAAPLEELAALISRVSVLAAGLPELAELDLNPVLAGPQGLAAVDARARVKPRD